MTPRLVSVLGLVLGLALTVPACSEDDVVNPSGRLQLWIAQTLSGRVTRMGVGVAGATVSLQYSNNAGFGGVTPQWFPASPLTATTNSDGYFAFDIASWLRIEPPVQDGNYQYNVWLRYLAGKSGVGGTSVEAVLVRSASESPPTGNLNPYRLVQNFSLPP